MRARPCGPDCKEEDGEKKIARAKERRRQVARERGCTRERVERANERERGGGAGEIHRERERVRE